MGKLSTKKEKAKVFIIGLDGATFDLIKPWIATNRLPNIASLMENGIWGDLETVIHPLTAPAWTSFMTGKNPGKHGIFDFILRKPNSYDIQLINAHCRDDQTLWKLLGNAGKKVGIINVPVNYPPEKVNGFLVSWMDAPGVESTFTYPEDLYRKIKRDVGEYKITADFHVTLDKYVTELHDLIENRATVTEYLMEKYEWDFFMVLFGATDFAQHAFWKYMDETHPDHNPTEAAKYGSVIQEVYEKIDKKIGRFLEKLGRDTIVIIMSDHGAGPLRKVVNLNRWLFENGWLAPTGASKEESMLRKMGRRIVRNSMKKSFSLLKRKLPVNIKGRLRSLFPNVRNKLESYLLSSQIDWSQTKAFSLGAYGNIWINLKGREPRGTVEPGAEYETLRSQIIDRLLKLQDPDTMEEVVSEVYRREELYHGRYLDRAADLIVRWKDYAYHSRQRFGAEENSVFESRQTMPLCNLEMNGYHTLKGILIIKGRHSKKNLEIRGAHITDVAPTILYLMNVPIPEDIDGRVLTEAFEDTFKNSHSVKYSKRHTDTQKREETEVYSEEDAESVKKRLQELGYLG